MFTGEGYSCNDVTRVTTILYPPLLAFWNKIDNPNENIHHLVDWEFLHIYTKKSPRPRQIWATRLAFRKFPKDTVMGKRGAWPSAECPRGYGYITEDTEHIFQCRKGDNTIKKSRKTFWNGENATEHPYRLFKTSSKSYPHPTS